MNLFKKVVIVIGLLALLGACATVSEQKLKLAQQSVERGAYNQAFDHTALSLQAEIANQKALALFSEVSEGAYRQKLAEIEQAKAIADWDRAAYAYDRIIALNKTVQKIQLSLKLYIEKNRVSNTNLKAMDRLLQLQPRHVNEARSVAYEKAAEAHYLSGQRYAAAQTHRQASSEFNKALSFINPYKNALSLASKSKHLADLADAKLYYGYGVQDVQNHQHRAASIAFAKADEFIHGFKNAHLLAIKYKNIADQEDALTHYVKGEQLAANQDYRSAVKEFEVSRSFVADFRDVHRLIPHYTDLANRADALKHYQQAMHHMDQYKFSQAATEFDQANAFLPGFRDATEMAKRARSFIPPDSHQLKALVQQSVSNGIPLSWLHDVHRGYTEDVVVNSIRVIKRGHFNQRREFWPYRIRLIGTCDLEIDKVNEQVVAFDTVVDFRLFRDDFGDWRAKYR